MATTIDFIQYVTQQMQQDAHIRYIKMMGEYCLYYDEKVIALVTDNQLFIKDTPQGRNHVKDVVLQEAYPGSKQFLLIEQLDNSAYLQELAKITYLSLPPAKQAKKRAASR